MKGEPITFFGKKSPKRNYIFIDDLVKVIDKVINLQIDGIYSCSFHKDVSYEEVARETYRIFKKEAIIDFDTSKPDMPDNIFEYSDLLYKKIGYTPNTSIKEGIRLITRANEK
jgi:nucleoside-diphosphate-sugar epimerase